MDENAITMPDGTPLRPAWRSRGHNGWIEGEAIETENMANRRALEDAFYLRWYGETNSGAEEWKENVDRCLAALAYKRGTTVEVERALLDKKVAAKVKKRKDRRG